MANIPVISGAACAIVGLALLHSAAAQDSERPIWDYSLEDLMAITVVTPSKTEEQLIQAPSVVTLIGWKDIEAYGANSLFDVLDRAAGLYLYGKAEMASLIRDLFSLAGAVNPG